MIKRTTLILLLFFIFFPLLGCASTKVTSFKDPEHAGKIYKKIAVYAPVKDLESRQMLESTFADMFNKNGTTAGALINIFPPTRAMDEAQVNKQLKETGYDALLSIQLTEAWTDTSTTPGYAGTIWGKRGATTIYGGGGQISKPRVKFNLELLDLATEQKAWISSTFTAGNAYAGKTTLINSLAMSAVDKLKTEGLIMKPPEVAKTNTEETKKE